MTLAFTWPEIKGLLKICCQPNWHTGSLLKTKWHWNRWNEGCARLNIWSSLCIYSLVLPLQILCLETYTISLPQSMSAFCADLEFSTGLAVFTTFSTNNLIYKRKKREKKKQPRKLWSVLFDKIVWLYYCMTYYFLVWHQHQHQARLNHQNSAFA